MQPEKSSLSYVGDNGKKFSKSEYKFLINESIITNQQIDHRIPNFMDSKLRKHLISDETDWVQIGGYET